MSGSVWAPFKELGRVVNAAILKKDPNAYYNLETELKKHKPDFLSLLKNPVSHPNNNSTVFGGHSYEMFPL